MKKLNFIILLFGLFNFTLAANITIHHGIRAEVFPAKHAISVVDTLTLPWQVVPPTIEFNLHSGLVVNSLTPGVEVILLKANLSGKDTGMDVEAPEVLEQIGRAHV